MSLISELLKFWMMGLAIFLIVPVLGAVLPWSMARKLIHQYHSIAMTLLGRALLMQSGKNSYKLKKSTFDPKFDAERIRIKGKPRYFEDAAGLMSTFKNRSFGLVHPDRAVVLDARMPWFARRYAEMYNSGKLWDGDAIKAYFAVPEGVRELINLRDIKAITPYPGEPNWPDRIDIQTEKGQAGFNSTTTKQQLQLAMTALLGIGLMWGASQIAQSGAGSVGGSLPI